MQAVDAKNEALRTEYRAGFDRLETALLWKIGGIVIAAVGLAVAFLRYGSTPAPAPVIINNPPAVQAPVAPIAEPATRAESVAPRDPTD